MEDKVRFGVLDTRVGKIEYEMIFSKRKSVGICVDLEKGVTVRVPKSMSIKAVKEIVTEKENWIVKKSLEMKQKKEERPIRNYVNGEEVLYMGELYPLKIRVEKCTKKGDVLFNGKSIEVVLSNKTKEIEGESIRALLVLWYKQQAAFYVNKRVEWFSKECKETPKRIIVKEQKRRWGSCSGERIIRINWRCIMAPKEVFDYVIVHEMCHLKHMNHKSEFWNMVEKVMPNYRDKRLWLKEHGYRLEL